jgi:hypothetical protein
MEINTKIEQLESRITVLEEVVLSRKTKPTPFTVDDKPGAQKGPSAGLRVLVGDGYFETKHDLADVREALARIGFLYSRQAVDMALKRFSQRDGALVALKEAGRKFYALRR